MRRLQVLVIVCLASLLAIACLSGCGEGAAVGDSGGEAKSPIAGEWLDLTGGTVRFTEDTFFTSSRDETRPSYRYKIVSEHRISLAPAASGNGAQESRIESYTLDGDVLTLGARGSYYRPNSAALEDARVARQAESGKWANTAAAKTTSNACGAVCSTYVTAFENGFSGSYPDRISLGYSIGQYIRLKGLNINWDFATLKRKIGTRGYVLAAETYEKEGAPVQFGDGADAVEIVGWVKAGTCPSGGDFAAVWDNSQDSPLTIECSVHGEQQ